MFSPNASKIILTGKNHKRCSLAHEVMHEVISCMQWADFLEWAVSKKLISKETLANQAQKEMINLVEDKKVDKGKHENFRQSFEEVHKHLLTYQDMFNEFMETRKAHSITFNLLMTLSLSIIQDLRSLFLIITPKNSQFLKPQNLLLISTYFSSEIKTTI